MLRSRAQRERRVRIVLDAFGEHHRMRELPPRLRRTAPCGDRRLAPFRRGAREVERVYRSGRAVHAAPAESILIVDGTFLQRPELATGWDVTVFLDTSEDVSERRGVDRDAERLGGLQAARQLYAERYRPAFGLYEQRCQPLSIADVIVDNNDIDRPRMRLRSSGILSA